MKDYKDINITVSAKVALCIEIVKRMRTLLIDEPKTYNTVDIMLSSVDRWLNKKDITANILYAHMPFLNEAVQSISENENKKQALISILSAFYYIIWRIDAFDWHKYHKDINNLPSDMAEITDEYVRYSLEDALKASNNDEKEIKWQNRAINKLVKHHTAHYEEEFGEPIESNFFEHL